MTPIIFLGIETEKQFEYTKRLISSRDSNIFKAIEEATGVTFEQIASKSRKNEIVEARFIFLGIKKIYGAYSPLKEIGKLLNRDHATIIYGQTMFEELSDEKYGNKSFKIKVSNVIDSLIKK